MVDQPHQPLTERLRHALAWCARRARERERDGAGVRRVKGSGRRKGSPSPLSVLLSSPPTPRQSSVPTAIVLTLPLVVGCASLPDSQAMRQHLSACQITERATRTQDVKTEARRAQARGWPLPRFETARQSLRKRCDQRRRSLAGEGAWAYQVARAYVTHMQDGWTPP
mgnify:FL=1